MPRFAYGKSADTARDENVKNPYTVEECLEWADRIRRKPNVTTETAEGLLCLADEVLRLRKTPNTNKPIDFNFYWEILGVWVSDFNPRVSVHQLRGLCERLTTITASNIGLDPIEALHCGKTPNTDFNLTPPTEPQVKS